MDRVLLVDNDLEQLAAWADLLKGARYDVTTASSVPKAQEYLINEKFDLAILDLHLERDMDPADESGLNLARLYREKVPVILLTGLPTVESAVKALQRDGQASPAVALVRKQEDGPKVLLEKAKLAIVPKVFVAHGHDEEVTADVIDFLKTRGAHAVVLKEETNASQTVLEAFEEHANVQFALVLMTPDDEGRRRVDPSRPINMEWENADTRADSSSSDQNVHQGGTVSAPMHISPPLQARARQNVVFELGFFLAKLGRNRVVALEKQGGSIEVPSNYRGVLTETIDPGGLWRDRLAQTIRKAGIALR